jgi:hypothetical protein
METMGITVGVVLALLVGAFARAVGLDRERSFYSTVLIVVASYYVLFAVMGGSARALLVELAAMAAFVLLTVAGFKRNLWLVAAGLAAHGAFDLVHARIVHNPGVPGWWPPFCLAYDVTAAAFLMWVLRRDRVR